MRQFTNSRPERSEGMPIGELSRLSGVNIETIRYYERIEIIPAAPRAQSGRRLYSGTDVRVLAFTRRSRELEHLTRRLNRLWIPMTARIRFNNPHWYKGASHEWGSLILTICANVSLLQSKPAIRA